MSLRARLMTLFLFALPAFGADPGKPIVPAQTPAELETRLTEILKKNKVPGMCTVIANREGLVWTAGIGQADVAANKTVTPDTLFRIGSVTKMFVGLAALKLVEEGRLDLNATVKSLLPGVQFGNRWEATDPVRVVHLLEHTTGWDDSHLKELAFTNPRPISLTEALAIGPESRISRWRPGTRYAYCNSGPAVAALIIEKIAGRPFEDYVAETFFQPIGMPTADFFYTPRTQERLTQLYHADGLRTFPYWHVSMRPAGSINASAREMGALLRFFLGRGEIDGHRLLSEASLQRMETPATYWGAQGGLKVGYGLHNYTKQDDRGFTWHGHNGGVEGGLSNLAYLPEQGLGYFLSINGGSAEAFMAVSRQLQAYVTRDLAAPTLPQAQTVPAELARGFSGWYGNDSPRNQPFAFLDRLTGIGRITFQDTRMRFKPLLGSTETSVFVGGHLFRGEKMSEANLVLVETPEGKVAQSNGNTMIRLNPVGVWLRIALMAGFLFSMVSVPLFALIWGTRWLFRRLRGVPALHVRVLPLLAALSFLAVLFVVKLVGEDTIMRLGHRTFYSLGICLGTWAFAGFSIASLWAALRVERRGMNRGAYIHSLIVAICFVAVTLYLGYWGVIGLRTWA